MDKSNPNKEGPQRKPKSGSTASTKRKRKRTESTYEDDAPLPSDTTVKTKKAKTSTGLNPIRARTTEKKQEPNELTCGFPLDVDLQAPLLRALVAQRNAIIKEALDEDHWASVIVSPLGPPHNQLLPGENRLRFTDTARHFIRWNIYPLTEKLEDFITRYLPTKAINFLDDLQQFADRNKDPDAFDDLAHHVLKKIKPVSKYLPPKFSQFIFAVWSKIENYELANHKTWGELDWCKDLYSLIDELMLKAFDTRSNRQTVREEEKDKIKPDFQVSKKINDKDVVLLVGKDDPLHHSGVGHKNTVKLLELLHGICQDTRYDGVSKYGVLNDGNKSTLFRAEVESLQISVDDGNQVVTIPKYNIFWILEDEKEYTTFKYSFGGFSKLLKTLAALFLALKDGFSAVETKTKEGKSKKHSIPADLTPKNEISAQEFNDQPASADVAEVKGSAHEENKEKIYNDDISNKDFTHLYPDNAKLLDYNINSRSRNIYYITSLESEGEFIAKWCYSEGRDLPYEIDVIGLLPLKTVLQPIEWASVDNNRYQVMIFDRLYHSKSGALLNFVASVRGIVATLRYMHKRGLVHGDVKYDNTMYSLERGPFIFDFECTHLVSDGEHWFSFGTSGHRAPEQILGGEFTYKSEMYSVGIWLIEWFFQRSLERILASYRPDFSDENEIDTGKVLLEVFEEYVNSQPSFKELWRSHPALEEESTEPCLTIEQFETFKVMIRDLLNEDPEKRPTCNVLLRDPKYKAFFGDQTWKSIIINKKHRTVPKTHVIESYFGGVQKRKEQKTFNGAASKPRNAVKNITNVL